MFSLDFIKLMLCMKPAHQFKIWWAEMRKKIEAYPKPSQTSKMDLFAKIVNGFHLLTNFVKSFILNVWLGSECASRGGYAWSPPQRWHSSSWAMKFGRLRFIAQSSSPEHSHNLRTFCSKLIVFYKKVLLVLVILQILVQ